jgi:PTH1 family peptidyl-tRNA hydrolase
MKLIVWLWNPWKQYEKTRHNVWFIFLDKFRKENNFSNFKLESKFKWEISEARFENEKTILLKPQTFMNLSWESLRKIVDFYKIEEKILLLFLMIKIWSFEK